MLAVVTFIACPILLAIALAVRFAGNARVLNTIDYARVASPRALHRWVGNWLLLLPLFTLIFGLLAFHHPTHGALLVIAWVTGTLAVAIRIAVGSARFHVGSADSSARAR